MSRSMVPSFLIAGLLGLSSAAEATITMTKKSRQDFITPPVTAITIERRAVVRLCGIESWNAIMAFEHSTTLGYSCRPHLGWLTARDTCSLECLAQRHLWFASRSKLF